MKKVYLAGPISGYSYKEVNDWREYVKEHLDDVGISAYSPMRGKVYLSKEEEIQDSYSNHTMSSIDAINIRDYNDVKTSDAILVNFLDSKKVSIGTVMEIAWARAFQIPVVIVMEKDNLHKHGMLTYNTILADTLDEGMRAIIQIINS